MQRRAVRILLVALLFAAGGATAFVVWRNEKTLQAIERDRRTRTDTIERLLAGIGDIGAAQQAYVADGQRDNASLVRVSTLLDRITTDAAGLRATASSGTSAGHLEEFWAALSAAVTEASRARQLVAAGDTLAASDLLFATARPHIAALDTHLRAFREAEREAFTAARAEVMQRSWMTLGGTAILWAIGLLALTPLRTAAAEAVALPVAEQAEQDGAISNLAAVADDSAATVPEPSAAPAIDLAAAADVCAGISQLADAEGLPGVLERAARLIDARGLVVWMGAGDELFPATGHGYPESTIRRLPPIKRRADNATAAAWRRGEVKVVAADASNLGAIVAPMFGASGCVGVLAAEVRNGREADPAARAVTSILASQLALVLSAWPSSSAADARAGADAPPRVSVGSDRQAAAS